MEIFFDENGNMEIDPRQIIDLPNEDISYHSDVKHLITLGHG
jgi:hypothetical protein